MSGSAPSLGSSGGVDRRARRLVTMRVSFQAEGEGDVRLTGYSTGLNEHGLAGRVNITGTVLRADPTGMPVRIFLELPAEAGSEPVEAEVIRVSPSWVPGHRYFVALRFTRVRPETVNYLRRFIRWREEAYFQAAAPPREFYLYDPRDRSQYGPLTGAEAARALQSGEVPSGIGLLWSTVRGEWVAFDAESLRDEIDRRTAEREEHARAARAAEAKAPAARAAAAATPAAAAPAGAVAAAPVRHAVALDRLRGGLFPWVVWAVLAVAAVGSAGWWIGWLDASDAAQAYREGAALQRQGHDFLAVQKFTEMMHRHRGSRWYHRAEVERERSLRRVDHFREQESARARLEVFQRVPPEVARQPAVVNNIGECLYRLGRVEEAERRFRAAVSASPQSGKYRYNLATALARLGRWEEAVAEVSSIGDAWAARPEVHLNVGIAHLAVGRREEAMRAFDKAAHLAPEDVGVRITVEEALRASGGGR